MGIGAGEIVSCNVLRYSRKLDPKGEFILSWVPELKHIKNEVYIHDPWNAASKDESYPSPIECTLYTDPKARWTSLRIRAHS